MLAATFTKSFSALVVGGLVCAGLAIGYAVAMPVSLSVRETLINVLILIVLGVIAEELNVSVANRVTIAASNLSVLLAIMLLGLWPALLVAAAIGLWGSWRVESVDVLAFNAGSTICAAFAAWLAFDSVVGVLGVSSAEPLWGWLLAGLIANVVHEGVSIGAAGVGSCLKYRKPLAAFWHDQAMPFIRPLAILTALGLAVAAVYATAGVGAVVLLFVPLFAAQYMFRLLVREREHVVAQTELTDKYLEMNIGLAAAMVVLLDSKDQYTAQHSAAVAMYCRDIATNLGLSEDERNTVHFAGLLHDLGKVGVPDAVLRKESRLTADEWALIRQHPAKGAEVLSHLAAYQGIADVVLCHHERLDGSGYPRGVSVERIPELSKILAVADAYHAMTSDRPYRAAFSSFEALRELRAIAGTALEAKYVEALARVLRDKGLAYRNGSTTDFMGEFELGRINLRLHGQSLADLSGLPELREDQAAT